MFLRRSFFLLFFCICPVSGGLGHWLSLRRHRGTDPGRDRTRRDVAPVFGPARDALPVGLQYSILAWPTGQCRVFDPARPCHRVWHLEQLSWYRQPLWQSRPGLVGGGIALGNLFVLVPIGLCRVPSHTWPMLAAALLTFPLTYGVTHRALARPLERALDGIELAQVCVVQQETHDTDWANATSVRSPDQLDLGWIIGEPSPPRVSLWQDGTLLRWRYGKSRFEQIGADTQRPAACVRP